MKSELKLQNQKLELIQWLSSIEDLDLIQKLIDIKDQNEKDWWDQLSTEELISIEKRFMANGNKVS
jgi:hypothetical protein